MSMIDSIKATYKELPKHPNEQSRELYIRPQLDGEHPNYKYTFLYRIYGTSFGITVQISEWELMHRRIPFDEQEFIDRMMMSMRKELKESQFKVEFPEEKIYTRIIYQGAVGYPREVVVDIEVRDWYKENPHVRVISFETTTEEDYKRYIREIE
jgi:hypothetical protein